MCSLLRCDYKKKSKSESSDDELYPRFLLENNRIKYQVINTTNETVKDTPIT